MRAENTYFSIENLGENATIYLYDVIGEDFFGGIGSKRFADELATIKNAKHIDLRINSPGGSVFEGNTIYTLLKSHKAKINVYVDGMAASIASVIAMAGDTVEIATNGMFMIHNPMGGMFGTAEDFRREAVLLDKVRDNIINTYISRTGGDVDELSELMDAETWFTAQESVDRKFADHIGSEKAMAACVDPKRFGFKNVPATLLNVEPPQDQKHNVESIERMIAERKARYRQETTV